MDFLASRAPQFSPYEGFSRVVVLRSCHRTAAPELTWCKTIRSVCEWFQDPPDRTWCKTRLPPMPVESRDLLDGISRAWTHPGRRAPNDTPITHPLDPGRPYTLSLSRLVHPPKTHVLSSPAIPNARRDRKTTTGNDGEPAAHTLFYTAIITTSLSRLKCIGPKHFPKLQR